MKNLILGFIAGCAFAVVTQAMAQMPMGAYNSPVYNNGYDDGAADAENKMMIKRLQEEHEHELNDQMRRYEQPYPPYAGKHTHIVNPDPC